MRTGDTTRVGVDVRLQQRPRIPADVSADRRDVADMSGFEVALEAGIRIHALVEWSERVGLGDGCDAVRRRRDDLFVGDAEGHREPIPWENEGVVRRVEVQLGVTISIQGGRLE